MSDASWELIPLLQTRRRTDAGRIKGQPRACGDHQTQCAAGRLAYLEYALSDQLALLENRDDDLAEAEMSGEFEREHRSYHPMREA